MNRHDVDTWYVLTDGTKAHPADVAANEAGALKHSNGLPVALRENGLPLTTGDANKENAMAASGSKEADEPKKASKADKAKAKPAESDREIKAGDGSKTYETR